MQRGISRRLCENWWDAGAGQINQSIQQLDRVIQQNATSAEEMAATAEELSGQATQLAEMVDFFTLGEESRSAGDRLRFIAAPTETGRDSRNGAFATH